MGNTQQALVHNHCQILMSRRNCKNSLPWQRISPLTGPPDQPCSLGDSFILIILCLLQMRRAPQSHWLLVGMDFNMNFQRPPIGRMRYCRKLYFCAVKPLQFSRSHFPSSLQRSVAVASTELKSKPMSKTFTPWWSSVQCSIRLAQSVFPAAVYQPVAVGSTQTQGYEGTQVSASEPRTCVPSPTPFSPVAPRTLQPYLPVTERLATLLPKQSNPIGSCPLQPPSRHCL